MTVQLAPGTAAQPPRSDGSGDVTLTFAGANNATSAGSPAQTADLNSPTPEPAPGSNSGPTLVTGVTVTPGDDGASVAIVVSGDAAYEWHRLACARQPLLDRYQERAAARDPRSNRTSRARWSRCASVKSILRRCASPCRWKDSSQSTSCRRPAASPCRSARRRWPTARDRATEASEASFRWRSRTPHR